MLSSINDTADPCLDFKGYLNAKDDYMYAQLSKENNAREKTNRKFHSMFERLKNGTYEAGSVEEMVFKLYNTCQTPGRQRSDYVKYVQPDINLPWPLNTPDGLPWPKERFQWLVTLARLQRYGMKDVLLNLKIKVDRENHTEPLVVIKQSETRHKDLFRDYRIDSEFNENDLIEKGFKRSQAKSMSENLNNLLLALESLDEKRTKSFQGKRLTLQQLESDYGISLRKYLETVFERRFAPSFHLLIDDVNYLVELNQLLSTYNQEIVACYLMVRFQDYMSSLTHYNDDCGDIVQSNMLFASDLLFEEHVLGEKKFKEYQDQIPQIFKAIIKSFKRRLERNRLNLPLSQISAFIKFLDGLTINVGSMPSDKDHRSFVMDYYADLDLDDDDNLDTMRLKLSMLRTRRMLEKLDQPVSSSPSTLDIFNGVDFNTINIPYILLSEPLFMTRGHEVFKFGSIGTLLAEKVLGAFHNWDVDFNCEDLINLGKSLDDHDIYTNKTFRCSENFYYTIGGILGVKLNLMSLVHDAYFSTESGYDHLQHIFTDVPLKQLFFIQFAQRHLPLFIYYFSTKTEKLFLTMPAFIEAFNCSNSPMIHQR
ncbi:neprilysin-1-like [Drosophila takahashii]|uniref:neprilysin-1-like n=1 Tax=Drosophila takahashii TaxID=29030 RepID=UPI001CF8805A|nr:uncharacterized protein LOC108065944 [Drosophila takahashii]